MSEFNGASVKVMRSYEYCHFEVCLSSDTATTVEEVDELRKDAQRLTDKAVKQYKIAKQHNWESVSNHDKRRQLAQEVTLILQRSEQDRTPEEKAKVKLLEDAQYWESQSYYDYQDDWDEPI